MVFSVKNKGVLFGKTSDAFWIMRSCDELPAGLEGLAERNYKVSNLRQCEIIIWLIPKTYQWAVCIVRRKDHRANHKTLLAIRQVCERNGDISQIIRKLHLKT